MPPTKAEPSAVSELEKNSRKAKEQGLLRARERQLEAAAQPCSAGGAQRGTGAGPGPAAERGGREQRTASGCSVLVLVLVPAAPRGGLAPRAGRGPRRPCPRPSLPPETRADPAGPRSGRFQHGRSAPPRSALPPQGPRRIGAPEGPEPGGRRRGLTSPGAAGLLGGRRHGSSPPRRPAPPAAAAGAGRARRDARTGSAAGARGGQDRERPPGSPRAAPPL